LYLGKQVAATEKLRYRVDVAFDQAAKGKVFVCSGHVSVSLSMCIFAFSPDS
jgi:hypothetical protein